MGETIANMSLFDIRENMVTSSGSGSGSNAMESMGIHFKTEFNLMSLYYV